MNIKYLGTAAAEGIPGMFCTCDHCKRAVAKGGRNLRTRSQALVSGRLLIDFPPDTYIHVLRGDLDLTAIASVIITHSHSDHFHAADLWCRDPGPAPQIRTDVPTLTVYGLKPVYELASQNSYRGRVAAAELTMWETSSIDGMQVTPLDADHDHTAGCTLYLISDGGKTMLYAHDTGYFPEATFAYLKERGIHLDFVSLDCCNILLPWDKGHMGLDADRRVRDRLIEDGSADASTIFAVNHFSHNGGLTHDELEEQYGEEFLIAYDGRLVEF